MFLAHLTCALALTLSALANRAESPTAIPTQAIRVHLAQIQSTDSFLSVKETSLLDDEMEEPDEEEDDAPDDPGQALKPDDDSTPLSAVAFAPNPEPCLLPVARPHVHEAVSAQWDCPRFLSLCRFRC